MNKYFLYAASVLALTSCSSDDFLGEDPGNVQNATNAINFSGDAGKITRATSNIGDDHVMLDNQFKVYGVKKVANGNLVTVFKDYSVLYNETLTTSNTNKWEYVKDNQTIKYWDYSASEYHFVAGSPINAFTYNVPYATTGAEIKSATISGLAGHINANNTETPLQTYPVYVAEPVKVAKKDYNNPVTFNFVRQQAMVRVGLYETIPGYFISEIKFYQAAATTATSNNVILTSATADYFVGGNNVNGTIKYDWTNTPSYTYEYNDKGLTKSSNWYAGKFAPHTPLATTSIDAVATLYGTDQDMSQTGYFTVLSTPSATEAQAIVIKCDYTLTSDDGSGETIKVTGATAAIPAAYSKWDVNTRYTYLFKISQNTNGTTGGNDDPAGLYPITFDAVVTEMTDETQGTTTTVATPSITTHQEGSVTENGIEYKSGSAINVTVTNEKGEKQNLTAGGTAVGSVAVYKFDSPINEAELQLKDFTGMTSEKGSVEATDNTVFTFTPGAAGYYAIQYLTKAATTADPKTPAAYTYKVVYVAK